RVAANRMGDAIMSAADPTGISTPRETPRRSATNPTAGGITIAPSQPPVVTRLIAVPTIEGKYLPASPKAVGKIGAINQPAANAEATINTRLRARNIAARKTTEPAALISNNRSGPKTPSVHCVAHRPAIMARAKAEIILDADFWS